MRGVSVPLVLHKTARSLVVYWRNFLHPERQQHLLDTFAAELPWRRETDDFGVQDRESLYMAVRRLPSAVCLVCRLILTKSMFTLTTPTLLSSRCVGRVQMHPAHLYTAHGTRHGTRHTAHCASPLAFAHHRLPAGGVCTLCRCGACRMAQATSFRTWASVSPPTRGTTTALYVVSTHRAVAPLASRVPVMMRACTTCTAMVQPLYAFAAVPPTSAEDCGFTW